MPQNGQGMVVGWGTHQQLQCSDFLSNPDAFVLYIVCDAWSSTLENYLRNPCDRVFIISLCNNMLCNGYKRTRDELLAGLDASKSNNTIRIPLEYH